MGRQARARGTLRRPRMPSMGKGKIGKAKDGPGCKASLRRERGKERFLFWGRFFFFLEGMRRGRDELKRHRAES